MEELRGVFEVELGKAMTRKLEGDGIGAHLRDAVILLVLAGRNDLLAYPRRR